MSLVLMAIAYGLFEEVVVIRSILNINWSELGAIGQYNYWGGINWTYGLMLIHFHIVVSIVSSVFLTEMIFPDRKKERWLSNPALIICGVLFALWIPAGYYMIRGIPSVPLYITGILVMFMFVYTAYKIASNPFKRTNRPVKKPRYFFILGFINMIIIFFGTFFEGLKPPLAIMFTALLLIDILSFALILRWSQNGYGWTERHKVALVSGFLMFFILISAIKDMEGPFAGYSIVSAASIVLFVLLYMKVKKREVSDR